MPYAKWGDVNDAIKGIKPQVTLAMANHIAAVAEAIERRGGEYAWPTAIAQFKREYKVSGGRWVKRRPAKEGAPMAMGMLDLVLQEVWEAEAALLEQRTKAVSGRRLGPDDFLVVEDPEKPTTWHLPVKVNGRPNRRLAAAAWAALFSSEGFRGNRYAGPDASKAKRELKALYKAEEWEMPEVAAPAAPTIKEGYWYPQMDGAGGTDWDAVPSVPYGAKSFADVDMANNTKAVTQQLHGLTYQFGELARYILNDSDPEATAATKLAGLRDLVAEFLERAEAKLGAVDEPAVEYEAAESAPVKIGETHAGAVLGLAKVELAEGAAGAAVPMTMDVVLIEPGFGNARDKNWYGRDMLGRDATVFEGAKMYETDHRAAEKSTRTWVSTVQKIKGATETGAPVAEVVVHDPGFAERVRALDTAGMLDKMECSILAGGVARKGKVNGQEANIVERITEAQSVDWVTRAGAGGRALQIAESEGHMDRIVTIKVLGTAADEAALTSKLGAHVVELFGEGAKVEKVELAEVGQEPEPAPKPEGQPDPAAAPKPETFVEAAAVKTAVDATNLPAPAKARLAEAKYADQAALDAAIARETEYVKVLSGSGQPFGQGPSSALDADPKPMDQKEYDRKIGEVFENYGLNVVKPAA